MKFLSQNQSESTDLNAQELQIKQTGFSEQKNSKQQVKYLSFPSQDKNRMNSIKFDFLTHKNNQIDPIVQDLVQRIKNSQKRQIIQTSKLFLQLGLSLSLKPQCISKINPDRRFVSNFIQFMGKIETIKQKLDQNTSKDSKIFLKTILYILMLLVCGDKNGIKNNELRDKLFQKKVFLKNFLKLTIYKHKKISKLYGIIIVYIYKNCSVSKIKKQLIQSIVNNLSFLDHQKTQLNILMILNQLKSQNKLKQKFIRQSQLIKKVHQTCIRNQHTYQSIYGLNYLSHLCYKFPNISMFLNFNKQDNFEITQTTKNFILTSTFYQRTLIRYFSLIQQNKSKSQILDHLVHCLSKINQIQSQFQNQKLSVSSSRQIYFYIKCIENSLKLIQTQNQLLQLFNQGFINIFVDILKNNSFEQEIMQKVHNILVVLISNLQTRESNVCQSLANYITEEIKEFYKKYEYQNERRQNIEKQIIENDWINDIKPIEIQ